MLVFLFHVFEFCVVFLAAANQGDHDCRAEDHRADGNGGKAEAGAGNGIHKEVQSNADDDGGQHCDEALDRQNVVAFIRVVRERHDETVHRHLIERAGEVIQQIAHNKPDDLRAGRQRGGHQIKHHGEKREQEERQPEPGQILALAGQFAKRLPFGDFELVDQITENDVIHRVNHLEHQQHARKHGEIHAAQREERRHKRLEHGGAEQSAAVGQIVVEALAATETPVGVLVDSFFLCHRTPPLKYTFG